MESIESKANCLINICLCAGVREWKSVCTCAGISICPHMPGDNNESVRSAAGVQDVALKRRGVGHVGAAAPASCFVP